MPKVLPPTYTDIHDEEVALESPNSEHLKRKLVHNANNLGFLQPLGCIRLIQINQFGVTVPDSTVWQLCDGSEITNPLSPFRSIGITTHNVPNLGDAIAPWDGMYLRSEAQQQVQNTIGGDHLYNLDHDHGGSTINFSGYPIPFTFGESGDERRAAFTHEHIIDPDLADDYEILSPRGYNVAPYMKVA